MIKFAKSCRYLACTAILAGLAGCASVTNQSPASIEQSLIAADKAYDAHNLQNGYKSASEAFIDFETAFMIEAGEGFLTDEASIMAERQLDTAPSPVHWGPIGAMAAASGDLGITWGTFSIDNSTTAGNYVTVWRKVNGEWKIVTDVAVDDPVAE